MENTKIQMIKVEDINILNPRIRNKKIFNDISNNILKVGLKRPITVTKSDSNTHDKKYDLVCGQGRLEAFIAADQKEIPAIIRDATEEQALIMSLVENLARKQHNSMYLIKGIEILKNSNYSAKEISEKIGLRLDYIKNIIHLIDNGEERLLPAVESGNLPISVAIRISNTTDDNVQAALQEAYENKQLRGKKLLYAKKLVELRKARGRSLLPNGGKRSSNKISTKELIAIYQKEVDRKRVISRKAEMVNNRLSFVSGAFRKLFNDEKFVELLFEVNLETMPKQLSELLETKNYG